MQFNDIVAYYSTEKIMHAIASAAAGREAVGVYSSGHYDSRPNVIQFAADVEHLARKGITSFHISVERWRFPMQLANASSSDSSPAPAAQTRYDTLRTGWDFVIDIDSKLGLEESTTAARLVCELFERYGISQYGLKFSGRRGWHICIPWEAMPKRINYRPAEIGYPEIPRILARFIRSKISNALMDELLKRRSLKDMLGLLDIIPSELNPFFFVELEQDWGARHLVRAPYSLNEKTWNVSLPIRPGQLASFSPDMARPEAVMKLKDVQPFFATQTGCAERFVIAALDWWAMQKKEGNVPKTARVPVKFEGKIGEENFPPCIKLILAGLKDGKKRSVFTLISFLRFANWSWQEIESKLFEWNEKNAPRLPTSVILSQLRWTMQQDRSLNPANCTNDMFYKSIGVCQPDGFCKNKSGEVTIKNPISYPFRKIGIPRKSGANSSAVMQPRYGRNRPTSYIKSKSSCVMRGFSCDECSREFKTMRALQSHKTRAHGG